MCGRFSFTTPEKIVAEVLQLASIPTLTPRYNIAPTQSVPAVLVSSENGERQLKMLRWGLIPSWAEDIKMGAKTINARAETVAEKPSFRAAFKRRRCLVLADGFYEWQLQNGKKQPFYFQLGDRKPFAFAGLWERWEKDEGGPIESCAIITTEANDVMQPIHDRMPVILAPEDCDKWLDPEVQKPELLQSLLQPYRSEEMTVYPVSTKVNNARTDSPDCIEKV